MKKLAILSLLLLPLAAQAAPCPCTDYFTGDAKPFIAEGIARDAASNRFFVGGVAAKRILMIAEGRTREFARLPDGFSPLGMAARGQTLWVAAATLPQGAGRDGPSALIAFDLGNGGMRKIYPVPDPGLHVLNDLALAMDGTVYLTDARGGSLYRLAPGAAALTRRGNPGQFRSPQGLVVSRNGKFLLVADYSLGLVRFDLATHALLRLQIPKGVNAKGIDGLARLPDGGFLASQNGLKNPRILRLTLSPDWTRLLALDVVAADDPAVSDPSLVMADESGAYLVGISQWASFDQNRPTPTKPLKPWRIIRLNLNRR
jgi:hypothetical protein